jgi:hypothetical protein
MKFILIITGIILLPIALAMIFVAAGYIFLWLISHALLLIFNR